MTQSTAHQLFGAALPADVFKVFDGPAPKAQRVLELLQYKKRDVAAATGLQETSIRFDDRMPDELRQRLVEWAIALNLVASFFGDGNEDRALLWFRVPNPLFGGITPRDMIRAGRFKKLLKIIQSALGENQPLEKK